MGEYLEVTDGLHSCLSLLCGSECLILPSNDLCKHPFHTCLPQQNILPCSSHEVLECFVGCTLLCS